MFVHITEFDWKHKLWVWGRISQGLLMALVSGHLSVNVYSGLGEAFWTWESSFSPRRYVQFALTPFQRALLPAEDLLALSQRSQSRLPNISDFGVCVGSKSMHPCLLGALSSRPWPNWYRSAIFKDVKASEVILFLFSFGGVKEPQVKMHIYPQNVINHYHDDFTRTTSFLPLIVLTVFIFLTQINWQRDREKVLNVITFKMYWLESFLNYESVFAKTTLVSTWGRG